MSDQLNPDQFDEYQIMKPGLYLGMLLNVVAPAGYFFLIYYLNNQGGMTASIAGESANMLFYALIAVSLGLIATSYLVRERLFKQPSLTSGEGASEALTNRFKMISIVSGAILEGIAVLGVVYFFLTARFQEGAILILIAAGAYQLIRPRPGAVDRFIQLQIESFNKGERPSALTPPQ
jgi:hypothetical protein